MQKNKRKNKQEALREAHANLFLKVKNWWPLSKVSGRIFLIYLIIILLGGFLLSIPGVVIKSSTNDYEFGWNFTTAIFTAVSAFSDTGINIVDPSHNYSFWGQLIILLLIEIGGIGVLTLKIILFIAINKKISLNDTVIAQSERGSSVKSSTIELIKDGFIWITFVQLTAASVLVFLFFYIEPGTSSMNQVNGTNTILEVNSPYHDIVKSVWFAIFHSTSAVNNAGFDIISSSSLQPYNVADHHGYAIQIVFLLEWVIGGLGYPTFHDIKKKLKARKTGQKVRFSLFTKLNFCVYAPLFVLGPLFVFTSEYMIKDQSLVFNYYAYSIDEITKQPINISILAPKSSSTVAMDIIFNTTACRNAGFSTIPIHDFNASSKMLLSTLMFIGSAPSSTAGGIRTTTFAIIILATWAVIRNRTYTSAFKKAIPQETVRRSFAVFFISIIIVSTTVLVIYLDSYPMLSTYSDDPKNDESIIKLLLLVTSAYGTVGMNPFSQTQMIGFGTLSKMLLLSCMFFGQLGVSNTLLAFIKPSKKTTYKFLEEDVTIG